jgi:hypothetical protein
MIGGVFPFVSALEVATAQVFIFISEWLGLQGPSAETKGKAPPMKILDKTI